MQAKRKLEIIELCGVAPECGFKNQPSYRPIDDERFPGPDDRGRPFYKVKFVCARVIHELTDVQGVLVVYRYAEGVVIRPSGERVPAGFHLGGGIFPNGIEPGFYSLVLHHMGSPKYPPYLSSATRLECLELS